MRRRQTALPHRRQGQGRRRAEAGQHRSLCRLYGKRPREYRWPQPGRVTRFGLSIRRAINRLLQERKGWKRYEVLPFFGFKNNYQLIISRRKAEKLGLSTMPGQINISDLAE